VFSSSFRVWGSQNDTPARNEGENTATIESIHTFFFIFGAVVSELDIVTMECSIVIDGTLRGRVAFTPLEVTHIPKHKRR